MIDLLLQQSFESQGLRFITPRKAWPLLEKGALLVDLRPDYEGAGKLPDVQELLLLSYTEIEENWQEIPRDEAVILADAVGIRSKEVLKLLLSRGYTNVVSLAGGFVDWERDGFPIIIDLSERLTGSCMCQLRPRNRKKSKI
ncbi:MAG: rhodanese-like domain-containing protein [Bacteroidales bacterium]|nr:rhodanese-like domain-containing protein [Bacteroidales bacterium]